MTDGTSQGLFVIVGIVIFGIFVMISYLLFQETLRPKLLAILDNSLTTADNYLKDEINIYIENESEKMKVKINNNLYLAVVRENNSYTIVGSGTTNENISKTGVLETTGDLILPDRINGLKITKIEGTFGEQDNPFKKTNYNGKLRLPKYLEHIGDEAFKNNQFTGKLQLPEFLKTIGIDAFMHSKFTGELILPKSLQSIKRTSFQNSEFTGTLVIPNSLEYVEGIAFLSSKFTDVINTNYLSYTKTSFGVISSHTSAEKIKVEKYTYNPIANMSDSEKVEKYFLKVNI